MKIILLLLISLSFVANATDTEKIPSDIDVFLSTRPEYKPAAEESINNHQLYIVDSLYIKKSGNSSVTVLVTNKKIIGYFVLIQGGTDIHKLRKELKVYYPEEQFREDGQFSQSVGKIYSQGFYFIDKSVYDKALKEQIESLKP